MCSPHSSLSLTCLGQGIDYIAPPGLTLEKQIRMTHQGPWLAFRQMPTDPRISRLLWIVCLISIISLRITSILKSSKRQNKCSKIILNLFQVYICISGIPLMLAHFTQFPVTLLPSFSRQLTIFLKTLIVQFLTYPILSLFIRNFWLHGLFSGAVVLNLLELAAQSTSTNIAAPL